MFVKKDYFPLFIITIIFYKNIRLKQNKYIFTKEPFCSLIATQKPRKYADELDSGWVTGKWDDGKQPESALLYSAEVC